MLSAGGPLVVPFANRGRGRACPKHSGQNALGRRTPCGPFCQKGPRSAQTKTLRPKCAWPADPLWSLLPKGTAVGTIILTPFLWSLLPKGTAEHHTNAKGTAVGAIILTPFLWSLLRLCLVLWSLLPTGTAEMEP